MESVISYRNSAVQLQSDANAFLDDMPVRNAVGRLSTLLKRHSQRCILRIEGVSCLIGHTPSCGQEERESVIQFESRADFLQFGRGFRLIDFARLYIDGRVNCDGPMAQLSEIALSLNDRKRSLFERGMEKLSPYLFSALSRLGRSRRLSLEHYGLSPCLYETFLDKYLQYTCALFETQNDDLETAQINKFRFIASGLGLADRTKHLDIGCGWGGAIRFFADQYGTNSIGITNSLTQAEYARRNVCNLKRGSAMIESGDFSRFRWPEYFDAITVVGMLEHVSYSRQREFFHYVYDNLANGGRVYIQCITKSDAWIGGDGTRFLQEYVFPGHYLDTVDNICTRARQCGLTVDSIYSHAQHYAETARRWIENLRSAEDELKGTGKIDDREYRILIGYLTVGATLFSENRGSLHRIFLRK